MKTVHIDKIPSTVLQYFAHEGIALNEVLISLRSDLRIDGSFGDCYLLLLKDKFAIAEGIIEITSGGKDFGGGSKRVENFKVSRFEIYSITAFGKSAVE